MGMMDYARGTIIERRLIPALFVLGELDRHSDAEIGGSLIKIIASDEVFAEKFLNLVDETEDRIWEEIANIRGSISKHKKK